MDIYFDTEFTGLQKDTDLISLGMVYLDKNEKPNALYIEFNDYRKELINPWLADNVINNLKYNDVSNHCESLISDEINFKSIKCNKADAKDYITDYFMMAHNKSDGEKVQLVSDVCHYDFVLLIDIFGGAFDLPDFVSPACIDLNHFIWRYNGGAYADAFDASREELVTKFAAAYKRNGLHYDKILDKLPKEFSEQKHNALYDAFVIAELYKLYTKYYIG